MAVRIVQLGTPIGPQEGVKLGVVRWAKYRKMYAREMDAPEKRRLLAVLARLSQQADFSIGCYCERADRCHRSLLGGMLRDRGAVVIDDEPVSPAR